MLRPFVFAVAVLAASPALAGPAAIPTSTDEARALAARSTPSQPSEPALPAIASSTDEARALAGQRVRSLQATPAAARAITVVSSTDEARAVASGLLVVAAPAERPTKVACGKSCACPRG